LCFGATVGRFRDLRGQRVLLGFEGFRGRPRGAQLRIECDDVVDEGGAGGSPGGGAAHALGVAAQERKV
jgi:hypothetical protein